MSLSCRPVSIIPIYRPTLSLTTTGSPVIYLRIDFVMWVTVQDENLKAPKFHNLAKVVVQGRIRLSLMGSEKESSIALFICNCKTIQVCKRL